MENIGYDSFLAICSVALIPALLWWRRQVASSNLKLYGYFLILFFAQGSLHLTHILNPTLLRYVYELTFVGLFFKTIWDSNIIYDSWHKLILGFVVVSLISAVQFNVIMLFLFLLYTLEVFMTLTYYRNNFDEQDAELINKLFIYLCISQIGAAVIKYFVHGIDEPYIGTMSEHEGGITTLFSLCAYCVSLEFYFCTRQKRMFILVLGFIVFGMVGAKRALAFFFPLFFFITLILHSYFSHSFGKNAKIFIWGTILMPLLFYAYCRINPSLNPEQEIGGSFDFEFVMEYSDSYNSGTLTSDGDGVGRAESLPVIFDYLTSSNIYNMLFGYGSGLLVASGFNESGMINEYSLNRFGVGYGINIGSVWMLVQVGIIGAFLYFLVYIRLLIDIFQKTKLQHLYLTSTELGWCISSILIMVSVLVVTIVYNQTAIYLNCCSVAIAWFISYALRILDTLSLQYDFQRKLL